eukprot:TRINITY_DN909_c0_g1_i1.p1 TRINITY_DN909_c0_g1~~TRINITY_DN909_c0_g1_i1.p1  ORF type:complete len:401 (-),score=113.24 TRINITY_DN909_c0_g1_i1:95-1297(-)
MQALNTKVLYANLNDALRVEGNPAVEVNKVMGAATLVTLGDSPIPTAEEMKHECEGLTPEERAAMEAAAKDRAYDEELWNDVNKAMAEIHDKKSSVQANLTTITSFATQADTHHLKKTDGSEFNMATTWKPVCASVNAILKQTQVFARNTSGLMKQVSHNLAALPPVGSSDRARLIKNLEEQCTKVGKESGDIGETCENLLLDLSLYSTLINDWVTAANGKVVQLSTEINDARNAVQGLNQEINKLDEVIKGLHVGLTLALAAASITAALVSCIPFVGVAIAAGIIAAATISFTVSIACKEKEMADKKSQRDAKQAQFDAATAQKQDLLRLISEAPVAMKHIGEVSEIVEAIRQVFATISVLASQLDLGSDPSNEDIRNWTYTVLKIADTMDHYAAGFKH